MLTSYDIDKPPVLSDKVRYILYQKEACPDTGKHHWQCTLEFNTLVSQADAAQSIGYMIPKRGTKGGASVRFDPRLGTPAQARAYCSSTWWCKEHHHGTCGCDPASLGGPHGECWCKAHHLPPWSGDSAPPIDHCGVCLGGVAGSCRWKIKGQIDYPVHQGSVVEERQRTDLEEVAEKLIEDRPTWAQICRDPHYHHVRAQYGKWLKETLQHMPPLPMTLELSRWQKEMQTILTGPVDPRAVYWLYEKEGNFGKSQYTEYLVRNHEALVLSGKGHDMKHAVEGQKVILFDLSRTQEDFISWQTVEEIKNGVFFSGKYDSGQKVFDRPHVVLFANFPPPYEKDGKATLSFDRWRVYELRSWDKCLEGSMLYDKDMMGKCTPAAGIRGFLRDRSRSPRRSAPDSADSAES